MKRTTSNFFSREYEEFKIKFDDESVEDAGGLLREWIHLTMKELFSLELGLF